MTVTCFWMAVVFQLKHFIADGPLQTEYMLGKFKKTDWVLPLAEHSGVHAFFTFLICCTFGFSTVPFGVICLLTALDFSIHFNMDRIKASPSMLGRFKMLSASEYRTMKHGSEYDGTNPELSMFKKLCMQNLISNTYFWWSLLLDQAVHHLTDLVSVFVVMRYAV